MTAAHTETAIAVRADIFTSDGFTTTMRIAEALVKSGILPRGVDTPFKAFAIIQKGREIGVGPMRALTGIHLIEGKPVVSPELKLEQFRERGGRVKWLESTDKVAKLWLRAPNGDEHTETVTIEEMGKAGVTGKDNWRKYPKSMLRARAVGFGLRAMGEGDGSYTPDELGAVTDEDGNVTYEPPPPAEYRATIQDSPRAASSDAPPPPENAPVQAAPPTGDQKAVRADKVPAKTGDELATKAQIARIHILVKETGTTEDNYRKGLGAYRKVGGKRCEHSNELTETQADNLIKRLDGLRQRQQAKFQQMESEAAENVAAIGGQAAPDSAVAFVQVEQKLGESFTTDDEENAWLTSLNSQWTCRGDIPKESAHMVLSLLLAKAQGGDEYDRVLRAARATGHIDVGE